MTSVINTTAVDLTTPAGASAAINVLDTAGGTKIAPATVLVDQTGAEVDLATNAQLIAILAQLHQALSVTVSNFPATQPISGAVTVSGSVEVANDSGNPLPVSGTVAVTGAFQATQPVSATALPLPAGAATSAAQTAAQTSLSSIDTKLTSQATGAKQDISNTSLASIDNKTPALVAGAVPVTFPVGAATSAKQDTGNTSLASIDNKTPALNGGTVPVTANIGLTNFVFSTLNTSVNQLAAGGVFAGAIEAVLSQPAASVICTSDQAGVLTINEYQDATGLILISSTLINIPSTKNYAESFILNCNYFQVAFKNTGKNTTTTFKLDTAYGTIAPATTGNSTPVEIRAVSGQKLFRTTFANSLAGVDPNFFNTITTGSGQTVNQTGGNLVITSGVTVNSETILRSVNSFSGSLTLREKTILSQRIINQNFFVELVDVIGDGLAATANSATSLTVTIPNCPFDTTNIGQSMYVGALSGLTGVPNRYTISAVSGNNVTFTVVGFTVGTGTVSLWGWNYNHIVYFQNSGLTMYWDTQRAGWNTGDTAVTCNQTASPGHMVAIQHSDNTASISDQLTASSTAQQLTMRGSRVENIPNETAQLFLQIRCLNGSTAPASTTTWTIGTISVEQFTPMQMSITDIKPQSFNAPLPVQIPAGVAITGTPATAPVAGTNILGSTRLSSPLNTGNSGVMTKILALATTNATIVKSSIAAVTGWQLTNAAAYPVYIKMFNTNALPVLGTTVPIYQIAIPAGGMATLPNGYGFPHSTGFGYAVTKGSADLDATAVAAGDVVGWIQYI